MFDYPLPLPRATSYHVLGIGPDAMADEVREVSNEAIWELEEQKAAVDKELLELYQQVPDLSEAEESVRRLKAERDARRPVTADKWASARKRLTLCEARARRVNADFDALRQRAADLGARRHAINGIQLGNRERRAEYDEANPPLQLLKLADCARDAFADPADHRLALALLRRELVDFLTVRGEDVFHPSDLTRTDFSGDFTPCVLLDGRAP